MTHGTLTGYSYGCRCGDCKAAMSGYQRTRYRGRGEPDVVREELRELLQELCPHGLTDDCPARAA